MKNLISMDKQYKTRSGSKVRILCIDSGCETYPVIAVVNKDALKFTAEGKYWDDGYESDQDLFEAPKEIVLYIEVFTYDNGSLRTLSYMTKEALEESIKASTDSDEDYQLIATKQITIVEGERV